MTHRTRSALGRFLALGSASALALIVAASPLAAQQTTGKIEGAVTDQQGGPVANAQVTIVGTSFGALTNEKGYYFINNVPVGTHTLRARFIGYTAAEVPGVRILGGQTITQNIKLTPSAVAIGPVTVEAASNPIVPRDQVTSKSIIQGSLVAKLPIDDVRQAIRLTPGVVESGVNTGLSIRGGRPGEANVYIDGAPVRLTNGNISRAGTVTQEVAPITISTNSVEEASVTTGALGVEFSDAQAGLISYTTRAGGPKFSGSFSGETDEPFGKNVSVGFNRFEGAVGGPVPRVANLTWFGSAVVQGQSSAFLPSGADQIPEFMLGGVDAIVPDTAADGTVRQIVLPRYVQYSGQCGQLSAASGSSPTAQAIKDNYGVKCQGIRRPMNWLTTLQGQGKLQYSYGSGSTISLTGLANSNQQRYYPTAASPIFIDRGHEDGRRIGNPAEYRGEHFWRRLAVLNWNHQVYRTAERALSINANLSWGRDRSIRGPLDPTSEIDTRDPTLGIEFKSLRFGGNLSAIPFPITDRIIRNVRSNTTPAEGIRLPLLNRTDLFDAQNFRLNPYGLAANQWNTTGLETTANMLSETRYTGRVVVDWQASRYHRFTLGGDVKKSDVGVWTGGLISPIFMDAYLVHPINYGFFGADRLDLGDVVLELGVRYDYVDSKALFPRTAGFTFTDPGWSANAATNDTAYANSLARVFTPSVGHHTLSPRLRVSFPITEHTDFRLSYAHQVQAPDLSTLLQGINSDLSFTNPNDVFGRDLRFAKTIMFEFGVRHAFSGDMVLDISAYNKDKVSDLAARLDTVANPGNLADIRAINVLTNRDFGNVRGVDVKFDRRWGNYVSATVAYTFQVSQNTGSDPFTWLNTLARSQSALSGDRTPPPEQAQRTDDDRTHNLVGALALSLPNDWRRGSTLGQIGRNVSAFLTFRLESGLPYTRLKNDGSGQIVPHLDCGLGCRPDEPLNNSSLPWHKHLDLRINKGVRLGRMDWTLYADLRNLLNFRDGAFAETGDVVNAELAKNEVGSPEGAGTGEYLDLWNEARAEHVFSEATRTVNLNGSCAAWNKPINCESLRRVEARFGNGDGLYTLNEQTHAIDTYYNATFGPWHFNGPARHIRIGAELNF